MARQLYRVSGTKNHKTWHKTIVAQGLSHLEYGAPDGCIIDVTPAPGRTYTRQTWPPRGRGRGEALLSPRRIEAKMRALEVVRLRLQCHLTWDEIARRLDFKDKSGPFRAYHRLLDRHDWDQRRKAELKRQAICERLGITQQELMTLWRTEQDAHPSSTP